MGLSKNLEILEPLMTNRWVIKMGNTPEYLFKDFKLKRVLVEENGKKINALKLLISHYNTVHDLIKPQDVLDIKKIKIEFLNPVGDVVNYYDMDVILHEFEQIGDYSDTTLLTNHYSFWVKDLNTLNDLEEDEKILENYKNKNEVTQ